MSKEATKTFLRVNPHDQIVYCNELGYERRYSILSVIVGGLKDDGFVEVEAVDLLAPPMFFPLALLELAISTGQCKIYHR